MAKQLILGIEGGAAKNKLDALRIDVSPLASIRAVGTRRRQAQPRPGGGRAQFMDLAGDGQPDLVVLDGPMPGLYEHDGR